MRQTRAENHPSLDYDLDYPPHLIWDLGDECRLSAGRDGDGGPWIVYVGLGPGERDIYCEVTADQLQHFVDYLKQLIEMDGRAD